MSASFWVSRRVDPIGLDLGARCIRMMQTARHRGQVSIIACGQRLLPPGPHSPAEYERTAVEAVRELLSEGGFLGHDVITHMGWDALQVRNLRVPVMPESEMAEVVRFEAGERFGLDPAEAELRFLVAGDVRQGTEMRQELIVLGAASADIGRHTSLLGRMGLRPVAIDAGPCAVFRGFERFLRREQDRNSVNAFVDVGYAATRLIVSRGPEIIFFKSIPVGGSRLDELTSEQLDLSLAEASQLRLRLHRQQMMQALGIEGEGEEKVGENTRQALADALRPAIEQLSKEIALCLRYCSVTFRGIRCDEVTAVGGEAHGQDLLRMLSDQVNVPFRVGRPMRNMASETESGGMDRRSGQPEWATVLGLALKPVQTAEAAA